MLILGFDPVFIDTIVRAETDEGNLISSLPEPGYHHRFNKIHRVAGGNSVNVAYVLSHLGVESNLVIPSNTLFDKLLKAKGLECLYRIHTQINETVAVTWEPGEIQFNHVNATLDLSHFSKDIYRYWNKSDIQVLLNWGLNPTSVEWISALWLSSCGWDYEEIIETGHTIYSCAIEETNLKQKLVLEPGSINHHTDHEKLISLLEVIGSSTYKSHYPILLANREESIEFEEIPFPTYIIHTSENVVLQRDGSISVTKVPDIKNIKRFVGAGDAFVAGLVTKLLESDDINIEYSIEVAQRYMTQIW